MASKEMLCGASVMAWITPVSCDGKNPLGMAAYSSTVSNSMASATHSVRVWCCNTLCRLRP